jgi:DNA-binding NarL/FixJ family response regulator
MELTVGVYAAEKDCFSLGVAMAHFRFAPEVDGRVAKLFAGDDWHHWLDAEPEEDRSRVVVLLRAEPGELRLALSKDARVVVTRSGPIEALQDAIEAAALRRAYFAPTARSILSRERGAPRLRPAVSANPLLTRREREVLRLLAEGKMDKEIATALRISLGTAKFHTGNILEKLGVASRNALLDP